VTDQGVSSSNARNEGEAADVRAFAFERIAELAARFPDLGLAGTADGAPPLARAIERQVRRRWLTLSTVVEASLDRGSWRSLEPRMKAVLLGGAAQLLLFDNEPDHAVVDSAVAWASRRIRRGAGGLANAVLRRVASLGEEILPAGSFPIDAWLGRGDVLPLEDGRGLRLREAVLPEDPVERLGAMTSHGRELLLHWINAHGFDRTLRLAAHGLVAPPIVIAGPEASLAALGERVAPHSRTGFAVWRDRAGGLAEALAADTSLRVQDPGSAAPVEATASLAPRRILDLCAGRGTKTRQLAALHPQAEIVAIEPDESRMRDLAAFASPFERIRAATHADLAGLPGAFDLILLDVPCSNTAVLPRRPEARYRFTARRLASLRERQWEIVQAALPLLSPSGTVLYATCSLEPGENERQAERIAHALDAAAPRSGVRFPAGLPGEDPAGYADGGYHGLLCR
jgi:16S rRNA (cytosine967-C5)-methyltransferase